MSAAASSPAEKLLPLLSCVKQAGPGRWTALCPAHADKRPSLHITEKPEGIVLLHCFSHQCGAAAIMQALGLSLGDLFPDHGDHHRPAGKPRIPASDILRLIDNEAAIVEIAASDIGNGFDLSVDDLARVQVAAERIREARGMYGH